MLFWSWAFLNMALAVGLAIEGVRRIRHRQLRTHRRLMTCSGALTVLFLVAYCLKVTVLGKEDLSSWTETSIVMLRIHELCVSAMLASGALAGFLAYRMRASSRPMRSRTTEGRFHRSAGWAAVLASGLALITAGAVLGGMYRLEATPQLARDPGGAPLSAPVGTSDAQLREPIGELPDEG